MDRFFGILGIILIFAITYLMSNNKKAINYKTVGTGFALQVLLAVFIFKVPLGRALFMGIGTFITKILDFAKEGGAFVFGSLIDNAKLGEVFGLGANIFALQLICSLIFMMILVNILYYYGIMQRVVPLFGKAMNKLMSVSGAEALSNVASAFVGQIAAQIMIRPYLPKLTRSELLASMAGSMACISAATMPIYIGLGIPAQYLLASSIMAAPGALVISKIMYPETHTPETSENITTLINVLRSVFSYVIIDTTSSFDGKTITALDNSDLILLIAVLNLPSVRNCQRCFDLFKRLGYQKDKIKLIVNRYMENDEIKIEDVEDVLGHSVYYKIPNNYFAIINAMNKGMPVSDLNHQSNIAKAFRELAALLSDNYTYSATKQTKQDERGFLGLFKKKEKK